MVVGLDKIFAEVKNAVSRPFLQSDLLWLLAKSLKDKGNREMLIQTYGLQTIVQELFNQVV